MAHGKSLEKIPGPEAKAFYVSVGNRRTRKPGPAGTVPLPEGLTRWDAKVSRRRRRRPKETRPEATNTPYVKRKS